MRVLGIDPGYAIVGWGVVEYISNRFAPIGWGGHHRKDTPFEQRLVEIYEAYSTSASATSPRPSPSKAVLPAQPDHRHRRG